MPVSGPDPGSSVAPSQIAATTDEAGRSTSASATGDSPAHAATSAAAQTPVADSSPEVGVPSDSAAEQATAPAPWTSRLAASLAGSALVSLVLALLDTLWASRASTAPMPWLGTLLSDLGLIAPVVVVVGLMVGALSLFVHPRAAPSVGRLREALCPADLRRRRHLAAWCTILPFISLVGLLLMANAALGILVWESSAAASGMALGMASAGLALGCLLAVFGGERLLAVQWRHPPPTPLHLAMAATAVAAAILALTIGIGTTSGAGGTLRMFGVLKRPELDLRAPTMILLAALGAYAAPGVVALSWTRRRVARAWWLLLVGVSPLPAIGFAAVGTLQDPEVALAVERGTALGKRTLPTLRRAVDRDRDGFAPWFGGGDCNDSDRTVNPGADDIPGNGKDEDCTGKDAEAVEIEKAVAEPASAQEWIRQKLPAKPNVVMLSIDTLRADAMGVLGYDVRPITKNLDALTHRSALFTRAYAMASYTGKSVGPTIIGRYTSETHRGWSHFNLFPKDVFVQERLQKAGIRTISCQGYWYFFKKGSGMERGFDVVDTTAAPPVARVAGDRSTTADKLSDAVIAQLSKPENVDGPFYLWAHYVDPHVEYVPHEEFDFGSGSRELYDGEIAFVDRHVGRVLDFIESSAFSQRTVIIVWSDHGEAFGEHGMIRHGFELWEPLVHVPLIIYVPGAAAHRVEVRRSLIDLVPTILDVFGVPPPTDEDALSGTSVLGDVLRPPGHTPQERIVFIDMSAGPYNAERQAFIEHDMKLVAAKGQPLGLYDLKKDPGEETDLLKNKAVSQPIVDKFKAFRRQLRLVRVRPR